MTEDFKIIEQGVVIAEIAQTHDGDLYKAHLMVDAVADAGAAAVKFQTHIADAESTLDEPWRIKFSVQDKTRFDYWKRMEFSFEQWAKLAQHAKERGLLFLSSPFSIQAVNMLEKLGVPFWKIPSGEISNIELMEAIWKTSKPILFSTGMCSLEELDLVVTKTSERNIPFGIFQCTSEYPCPPEKWGLNMIEVLKNRYKCPIGFSDHSGTVYAGLAAAAVGALFIEVRVTFSRNAFGPDTSSSITFDELAQLVEGIKKIRGAIESPVDKEKITSKVQEMRNIFGRSLALRRNLPAGTILAREHITLKKPGTGIPYSRLNDLLGKRLRHDTPSNRLLKIEDVEGLKK